MSVSQDELLFDLKCVLCRAISDGINGAKKLTGKEIVDACLYYTRGDLRNGDPAWVMPIYSKAYRMARVHCQCADDAKPE